MNKQKIEDLFDMDEYERMEYIEELSIKNQQKEKLNENVILKFQNNF